MRSAMTPRIHAILRALDIRGDLSAQELSSAVGGVTDETMLGTLRNLSRWNSRRLAYVEPLGGGREHSQVQKWRLTDAGRKRIRGC